MHALLIALAFSIAAQAPPAGSQDAAVMAAVNQFVNGFNQGDTKSALAACADQTSIIDEFPLQKTQAGWRITGWSWAKN